jgi:DNA-directed RNA polymerase specialized sigma subunit
VGAAQDTRAAQAALGEAHGAEGGDYMTTITLADAAKLHREQLRAAEQLTEATERRNQAVLFLLEQGGVRGNAIARELGISPTRVSQIAEKAREQQARGLRAA